ncbi:hypothetical protein FOXB_02419 [Fusarium oxysporum f. sp. conglutinans Fo5176]|uniref:Uncharacterized protein n=1 Tax=Fusarium oxysporum (strain Fo5176) TaxID=660025 RepID=F9F7P4_FUSOF|nr:hypothetical protein FOXB_02419 [Fusarium oxysporum f. sp. conglutinans Fo5176]
MPLASTEITWLLRYDVDHLWMSLHEAESRSFDRLQYDLIIGNWCSFSSSRFFQWSSHPNFVASGLRLSDLSVRDEVSPTCIGSNSAFSSQTLKHIYDALVLVRVSPSPCYVEANGYEVERRKESTVVLAVVATKKAHGASSTTAEEHVLQGKAERNGASIQVIRMPLPGRGIPGPWSHINVTSMQQLSVIGFKLISSVRTLNTIAYQAEAPSRLATHVTT